MKNLRSIACLLAFAAGATALHAVSFSDDSAGANSGSSGAFTLSEKTQVPGTTLNSGDYSIRVINSLDDRMIVRIDGTKAADHRLFLGIPAPASMPRTAPGPIRWDAASKGTPALRGFVFPSGPSVEFVYPKLEAVALATSNASKVVAIDPESEGRPDATKLTADDLAIVNLWTLAFTTVGKDAKTPAISAAHYQPEPKPVMPAEAKASAPVEAKAVPQSARVEQARVEVPPSPVAAAAPKARRHPAIARLPHTASPLPLIFLCGLLALTLAGGMRLAELKRMQGKARVRAVKA